MFLQKGFQKKIFQISIDLKKFMKQGINKVLNEQFQIRMDMV
jgi:hypothetical protein